MHFTILRFETIDSTNSEAARQAKLGADEGVCIIAQQQTQGRGRHGREWISEKDAGLYFSIVLRPKIEPRFLSLITLMSGIAVYDTLKEFDLEPDIKWVNDILIDGKKISGILAETAETSIGPAVIVGIGVNFLSDHLADDLAEIGTAIHAVSTGVIRPAQIEEALTKYLNYWYEVLCSEDERSRILEEWKRRSTYFSGKSVRVTLENEVFEGVTDGLEENGALRVRTGTGALRIVQAGDVERLRATPSL